VVIVVSADYQMYEGHTPGLRSNKHYGALSTRTDIASFRNYNLKCQSAVAKKKRVYKVRVFLESCSDVQWVRTDRETEKCTEGEDRSLSGSTYKGIAEFMFGMDLTAMRPVTMLIVCLFILHQQGRMIYF
jgi:hypothetical protein